MTEVAPKTGIGKPIEIVKCVIILLLVCQHINRQF